MCFHQHSISRLRSFLDGMSEFKGLNTVAPHQQAGAVAQPQGIILCIWNNEEHEMFQVGVRYAERY